MSAPQAPQGRFATLWPDFLASIVVFLVALPLCMGIAIASGVPVAAGLITGIVGGIVVGVLAGSPLQVSGPAAGLTVIIYEYVQRNGFEMLGLAVLIGGALQLVAGLFRFGQWFRAVSPAVIRGMLAGIGVLIFASQFHVMVDDDPKGNGIQNLVTIPSAIYKGLDIPQLGQPENREFRTEALRKVGELHRRQAAIAERVAERLPDHAPDEAIERETAAQRATEADSLRELLPEQRALAEEVERVVQEIEAFEREADNGERSARIVAACEPAVDSVREAAEDIEEGHVLTAMRSQNRAVRDLETLMARMKNHPLAAQIGILTIAAILAWQGLAPKRLKFIPAPLISVVLATGVAALLTLPILYVEVPDNLLNEIHIPTWMMLQDAPWWAVIQGGLVIAAVASAETLLCASAVDQLHQGPRTKFDKELSAQGVGNMICGVLGALPMTGVIVRSSANVQAGARTRLSAILHGFWLLAFVALLSGLLRLIPTSSLAAILVYTGYKLINPKQVKELKAYGWSEVGIYAATLSMIVLTDLLTGVIVGVVLTAIKLLYTFSHIDVQLDVDHPTRKAQISLSGAATFLGLPKLAAALEKVPSSYELHVDFQYLDYIDHACLDLLMNWAKQHQVTGGQLVIDWESLHARFRPERNTAASRLRDHAGVKEGEHAQSGT